ncbi:hypothetical protein DFJ43DRAFT_1035476 [Lentinula guzmanii]|uniref:WD40 repeat-like protein n=1 Tax=Lentinula guzmanii TaxID=2804957 RepID=A0AA38JXH2_9AGAR|nr:hypothetical protein DFJ43DRAFT_1035476 [Lentinula guzmanii]
MKSSYTQLGVLDAPTDFVHALSFSLDGRYLASATNDEVVRVYDIQRGFATIWEHKGPCPATAVMWRDHTLFVGSMDGVLICVHPTYRWMRRRRSEVIYTADEPISAMEFNTRGDHLLLPSQWLLESQFDTWESRSYWGPHDSYDLSDSRRYFGRIATSAKSPDSRSVVAANLCQGLDWFKIMPDRLKKMSSTHQPQPINIPLPVLFIDHGQAVIMGSTNGCALILEVKHGEKVQALKHGSDQTWVTSLRGVSLQVFPIMVCDTKDCIISAILWLWTPQWREASAALGIYFTKTTLPATPSPSLRPVVTSSPLMTKSRRYLGILEDLLCDKVQKSPTVEK